MHGAELDGVVDAVVHGLRDSNHTTRAEAATVAGELGPAASGAFDALAAAMHARGDGLPTALPALAALDRTRAIPLARLALDDPSAAVRTSAMRALSGLGPAGAEAHDRLVRTLHDGALSLGERAAALHALARVGPNGGRGRGGGSGGPAVGGSLAPHPRAQDPGRAGSRIPAPT